jgi:hypothetical protein
LVLAQTRNQPSSIKLTRHLLLLLLVLLVLLLLLQVSSTPALRS